MPRFLGYYVRDQRLLPIEDAIRKVTSLPAQREHLEGRGLLQAGFFADITVFDPAAIIDHATYAQPNKLSTGVDYVIVNWNMTKGNPRASQPGAPFEAVGITNPTTDDSSRESFSH